MIDASWYRRPPRIRERISAGGVVVRRRPGEPGRVEVALAREGDHSQYVLPKGKVEKGEALEEAARREIAEEAGLHHLTLLGELGSRSRLTFDKRAWVRVHYFLFRAGQEGRQPTDSKRHHHAAQWFPIDNLPAMFWPEQRELIESNREPIAAALER
jgi:8-oxo-dGTP pyrophosphatase MutT (NUDIX family)